MPPPCIQSARQSVCICIWFLFTAIIRHRQRWHLRPTIYYGQITWTRWEWGNSWCIYWAARQAPRRLPCWLHAASSQFCWCAGTDTWCQERCSRTWKIARRSLHPVRQSPSSVCSRAWTAARCLIRPDTPRCGSARWLQNYVNGQLLLLERLPDLLELVLRHLKLALELAGLQFLLSRILVAAGHETVGDIAQLESIFLEFWEIGFHNA